MTTNSAYQKLGNLSLPVSNADFSDDPSFSLLDPVRDRLLELFTTAINDEFGAAWTIVIAALPSGHGLGASPVTDKYPAEPTAELMTERKASFPALFLHRVDEPQFESHTMFADKLIQDWHMHWVLGPLDLEARRRILDLGRSIGFLLKAIERDFGHKSYQDGANQFEPSVGNLMSFEMTGHTQPGAARFDGDEENRTFWATRYTLRTSEIVEDLFDHEAEFQGIDGGVDVSGANHPDVSPDFIEFDTSVKYQDP